MCLFNVSRTHWLTMGSLLLAALLASTSNATFADELASGETRQAATTDFETLHQMVLPRENELKWRRVSWLTSITQARHRAAVEGKPLFVFADTGAGFADALGLC